MFVFLPWKFASPLPANFFHSTEIQEVKDKFVEMFTF
jgi:hypothetical protein